MTFVDPAKAVIVFPVPSTVLNWKLTKLFDGTGTVGISTTPSTDTVTVCWFASVFEITMSVKIDVVDAGTV